MNDVWSIKIYPQTHRHLGAYSEKWPQGMVSRRRVCAEKLLSSDQNTGFWLPTHSLSGVTANPSLLLSGKVDGRSKVRRS